MENGMVSKELYKKLRSVVEEIGARIREKERGVFPELAVTNISEVGKNSEEVVEDIPERDISSKKLFNVLLLVREEELLKMRGKKYLVFRSKFVPKALLGVAVVDQKVVCTIYDPAVPEWTVKEELKKFVRVHKEEFEGVGIIKKFPIGHE